MQRSSFGLGDRERGNTLILSFLLVTLLTALATAHFATVQKNSRQSIFVNDLRELRRYADSGVKLALHELTYDTGMGDGRIGTDLWSVSNDIGRDGIPGTHDEGEGDGIPTPGEPNLLAAPIGSANEGIGLLVSTSDAAWPNVKRIVSSAYNSQAYACVEVFVRESVNAVPGVGAVYVQPGVILDLKGNSFLIDGHDKDPGGSAGPGPAVLGMATAVGSPPGSNTSALVDQVPDPRINQIVGVGSNPSIGESGDLDFDTVFNSFKAARTNIVAPGTHSDVTWGDHATGSYEVSYSNGDVHLTGEGKGAGVLIVEGSLTITGEFEFVGIVIVRGDARLTGGGSGVHIYGSLMIGQTLTAIDPDIDLGMNGTADIRYSSVGIAAASSLLGSNYTVLYWSILK